MPIQLKIVWSVVCLFVGMAIYAIFTFPRDIRAESVEKISIIPQEVRCENGRRKYSPKWVYLLKGEHSNVAFSKEGACAHIRGELLSRKVEVYLHKPAANFGGYQVVEVQVESNEYVKFRDVRRGHLGAIALMFIVALCLFAGAVTYGLIKSPWSKSVANA